MLTYQVRDHDGTRNTYQQKKTVKNTNEAIYELKHNVNDARRPETLQLYVYTIRPYVLKSNT